MISFLLDKLLKEWGFEVVMAANGRKAWEILQDKDAPRIALLDWMMPEIDGLDLCRKVRSSNYLKSIYLILVTSKKDRKDIVSGFKAGADDYIAKPFDFEELKGRIQVGKRIIDLKDELVEQEKMKVILEMAGAVCHELNQPLQAISGYTELLLHEIGKEAPGFETAKEIQQLIDRMGTITHKLMRITRYKTKEYILGRKIIDLDESSEEIFHKP